MERHLMRKSIQSCDVTLDLKKKHISSTSSVSSMKESKGSLWKGPGLPLQCLFPRLKAPKPLQESSLSLLKLLFCIPKAAIILLSLG